jgi:coniferyl-aldehyde dehydrogenase
MEANPGTPASHGGLELRITFEMQRAGYHATGFPSVETRRDRIDRLIHLLTSHHRELVDALREDYGGRSPLQSLVSDIVSLIPVLKRTRKQLARWMRPQRKSGLLFALLGGRISIEWEPLGVVGIVSPWNFPINLTSQPLGAALAAGNRVMIKLSEVTPETGALFCRLLAREFDGDEVSAVVGGPELSTEFCRLPFGRLFFTGSTAVGRRVMCAASENLVPVTLELGGKSPVVIGAGADLERAARTLIFGKTLNLGQYCIAPDYLFLPRGAEQRFVDAARRAFGSMYPSIAHEDLSWIINEHHAKRLELLLDDARKRGARAVSLSDEHPETARLGRRIAPTLLFDTNDEMEISRQEIFGPLLPVRLYDRISDVIDYVNARPSPLAAYYFGKDDEACRSFVERLRCGGITINDIMLHGGLEDVPFGGVGESGMGAYHGRAGFETFSHAKPVFRSPRPFTPFLAPPYGARAKKFIEAFLRFENRAVERRLSRRRVGRGLQ